MLTLGPGKLLIALLPHPGKETKHLLELAAGLGAVALAAGLWLGRERLARRLERTRTSSRSPALLGAGIIAVELPTAVPYFAVIAAIADSRRGIPSAIALLVAFNLAFAAPLIGILVLRLLAGTKGEQRLQTVHGWFLRLAPRLVPVLFLVLGVALVAVSAVGLAGD